MDDIFKGAGAPLSSDGFAAAAAALGVVAKPAALWALLAVETKGFGYLPDRRPKILFERHVFHKRTGGRFSKANPDISNAARGGYVGGAAEYLRLKRAMLLDRRNALESASWGLGQIMGFNAASLGYHDVDDMIERFKGGEDAQLDGSVRFIAGQKALSAAFKAQAWKQVAFYYNGSSYAENAYDTKLAAAFAKFSASPPALDLRAAQARLTYLGVDPKGVDGVLGGGAMQAIRAFQQQKALPATGQLDQKTADALKAAAGV